MESVSAGISKIRSMRSLARLLTVTTRVSATAPIVTPSRAARKDSRGESILRPPDGSVMKSRNLGNSVKIVANTVKLE